MIIVEFTDGIDWYKANWAFRQLAEDTFARFPDDNELHSVLEMAHAFNCLDFKVRLKENKELAARTLAALRTVAEETLKGSIHGLKGKHSSDENRQQLYLQSLKELIILIEKQQERDNLNPLYEAPKHSFDEDLSSRGLRPGWHSTILGQVDFLGPVENGPGEQKFKQQLAQFMSSDIRFKAAYLAKIKYQNESKIVMALFVVTIYGGHGAKLTEQIHAIYKPLFPKGEYLDTIYLDDEQQEARLAKVCPPFYEQIHRHDSLYLPPQKETLTAIVCEHVASKAFPILNAARIRPQGKRDSGWRFFCKSGMPEDHDHDKIITVPELLEIEPGFNKYLDSPEDTYLWRSTARAKWEHIKPSNGEREKNGNNGHIGNGHRLPNGDLSFVRETGQPFDRGTSPAPAAPEDNGDPVREYIKLRAAWPHPVEIALYYECLSCGEILSAGSEGKCRCGNIAISSGVVKIENLAKASAFRQR